MNFGPMEIAIVAGIALLIFGPSQLPKLGRSLGATIKEFRSVGKELTETRDDIDRDVRAIQRDVTHVTRR
jgi:sec-independent protein translocase protein TatA